MDILKQPGGPLHCVFSMFLFSYQKLFFFFMFLFMMRKEQQPIKKISNIDISIALKKLVLVGLLSLYHLHSLLIRQQLHMTFIYLKFSLLTIFFGMLIYSSKQLHRPLVLSNKIDTYSLSEYTVLIIFLQYPYTITSCVFFPLSSPTAS